VLDVTDTRLDKVYSYVKTRLQVQQGHGGIARYEGDNYFRSRDNIPGNPWVITTLWFAEYEIARAKTIDDLAGPLATLNWTLDRTNEAGLLAEQYNPATGTAVSVTPLVWSHAQYVTTFLAYIEKLQALGICTVKL
jgi:GH15 family glucan-1,4-alpha-glucosidase